MQLTDVTAALPGTQVVEHGNRTIGAILVHEGRLTPENVERILRMQREQRLRFGEAGIQLGLLTQADVEFALACQFNYPILQRGHSKISEELIAAFDPFSLQSERLRSLRSQLDLRWFAGDAERKALTILSGTRDEGRTFIAANLAVMFSQLGRNTLLIDADLRNPRQHDIFGLNNFTGLSALISKRCGSDVIQRVPGLPDLAVLPAGVVPPNPLELLSSRAFDELLFQLKQAFDIIVLDSPAAASYADGQTLAVSAGAALIVVRKNSTRSWQIRGISEKVSNLGTTIVGTVLNDF